MAFTDRTACRPLDPLSRSGNVGGMGWSGTPLPRRNHGSIDTHTHTSRRHIVLTQRGPSIPRNAVTSGWGSRVGSRGWPFVSDICNKEICHGSCFRQQRVTCLQYKNSLHRGKHILPFTDAVDPFDRHTIDTRPRSRSKSAKSPLLTVSEVGLSTPHWAGRNRLTEIILRLL